VNIWILIIIINN